jgi:hypothetical protein
LNVICVGGVGELYVNVTFVGGGFFDGSTAHSVIHKETGDGGRGTSDRRRPVFFTACCEGQLKAEPTFTKMSISIPAVVEVYITPFAGGGPVTTSIPGFPSEGFEALATGTEIVSGSVEAGYGLGGPYSIVVPFTARLIPVLLENHPAWLAVSALSKTPPANADATKSFEGNLNEFLCIVVFPYYYISITS